jgi:hypothetical protein
MRTCRSIVFLIVLLAIGRDAHAAAKSPHSHGHHGHQSVDPSSSPKQGSTEATANGAVNDLDRTLNSRLNAICRGC